MACVKLNKPSEIILSSFMFSRNVKEYNINDVITWRDNKELVLVPKFQRREVWNENARSYLIDSVLRNAPIPIIIIRQIIDLKTGKNVREVVDGQQRLKAILDFYDGKLKINKIHNDLLAGATYSDLNEEYQMKFRQYELAVNVLIGASDTEVLDVFGRLNSYTVILNNQEKMNAQYHGDFKTYIYTKEKEFIPFFLDNKILSNSSLMRMMEAELLSELIISMIFGHQDKKESIKHYYKEYDMSFPQKKEIDIKLTYIKALIENIFKDNLASSNYRRKAIFYSLFGAFADLLYGMPEEEGIHGITISQDKYSDIYRNLVFLNEQLDTEQPNPEFNEFINACSRQTDNKQPRKIRHRYIKNAILSALGTK